MSLQVALSKDSASTFDAYCREYQKLNGSLFGLHGNPELLDWVVDQQQQYHALKKDYNTSLTEERIKTLESLGFDWGESVQDSDKEDLNQVDENSIASSKSSSSSSLSKEDSALDQDRLYESTDESSDEQSLSTNIEKNCSWDDLFEKLKDYVKKHKNFVIFCKNDELIQLNDWVNEQRFQYAKWNQGERSCLTPQKREKLNSISFPWDPFNAKIPVVTQNKSPVVTKRMRSPVVTPVVTKNTRPSMGIKKVKSPIKSKDIQDVKKARNSNNFNQQSWDLRYMQLVQHVKEHNLFKVSKKSNSKLYNWIKKQKQNQQASKSGKQNCMTEERQRKLDAISFPWEMPNCSSTSTAKPNLQSKPNKSKPPNKSKTPNQSKTPNKSKPQVKPKYNKPFRQARVELGKSSKSKAKTKNITNKYQDESPVQSSIQQQHGGGNQVTQGFFNNGLVDMALEGMVFGF